MTRYQTQRIAWAAFPANGVAVLGEIVIGAL
jgi:hypothetical protein